MTSRISVRDAAITVRPAVPEDAEKLRELRLAALAAHPEAFAMDAESVATETVAQWTERITRNIATHAGTICIAADGDQLIGMMGLYRDLRPKTRHGGTIWGAYVSAAWRSHHVAEALMSECLAWARGQELAVVKLGVITINTPAIRCYARCGFTVYGIEPKVIHYNGVFYDELLMARQV
jgi:RimJ/RimL family protein N-acetyltransferase